jgi:hypothetical protein
MSDVANELLLDINRQLNSALNGYTFEPSESMLQKRFVDRLAEVIGGHVHDIAKEHMQVSRVQDEIILELGKPLMDIVRTVYGDDIISILAPNAMIRLPGWRKPEQCVSIPEQEQTINVPLPETPPEPPPAEKTSRAAAKIEANMGGLEIIRVRVLFLEPGNKIHPSALEDCITSVQLEESGIDWVPEEYEAQGYLQLCKESLTDGLLHSSPASEFSASPNDPVMEVTKPFAVVYFDLLENNADWESGSGQVGYALENTSIMDVFGDHAQQFIDYAKLLTDRKGTNKSEWGVKVQFLTMWSCWSNQDYWGEWNSGEELAGIVCHYDMKVTKIKDAILLASERFKPTLNDPLQID